MLNKPALATRVTPLFRLHRWAKEMNLYLGSNVSSAVQATQTTDNAKMNFLSLTSMTPIARKQNEKIINRPFLFMLCNFSFFIFRGHFYSRSYALEVATVELKKYAERKGLDIDLFEEPRDVEINSVWGYDWVYKGEPRIIVGVSIDGSGSPELYSSPVESAIEAPASGSLSN